MDRGFKSILWTIVGILILVAVAKFIWWIIPYALVIGLVGYIVFKGRQAFANKNRQNSNTYSSTREKTNTHSQSNDDYTSNVIDVDYEDVDK